MPEVSVSPSGETFPLPTPEDYATEFDRVQALAHSARAEGREIVVVMGVGFVGAVMAAIIADATDEAGRPTKFVIGCQRPSPRSFWKIPLLNRGVSPVKAEDPEVDVMISRCVRDKKTLTATYSSDCLTLADCVVVDVQCDYTKHNLGDMRTGEVEMAALEATMRTIGEKIPADCLVVIETTVAPGTTEFVAYPIMKKAFQARGIESAPLLSHSYERVMPGKQYVASIRDFWRVCSGPSRARPPRSSRTPTGPPSLPFSTSGASSPSVTVSISPKSSRPSRSAPRTQT
jgi:UDP-N-acetyl-D-glucosamine dehydrogenase